MKTVDAAPDLAHPATVTALLAQLLVDSPQPRPALTYLRRKAGRGLVAVFGTARDPDRLFTVTVEERALNAGAETGTPLWQGTWPGLLADPALGLAVQAFPTDRKLPALAVAVAPATHPQLWAALQDAGAAGLPAGGGWTLRAARAVPIRYKPGDRCVIRYRLAFHRPRPDGEQQAETSVIGKLYRDPEQATAAAALLTRLRRSRARDWCPAAVGVVADLALLLSEDLGDVRRDPPTRTGTDVIRPGHPRAAATITAAARALVDLHTGDTHETDTPLRLGPDEAVKAGKRAEILTRHLPTFAPTIDALARQIGDSLRSLEPTREGPAHGSFKPSQLLVRDGTVFVVDFDQFCRADPALDVGYFLAYLRPQGLFYQRASTREWFESAAATFRTSYRAALVERGVPAVEADAILIRSHSYEAALLLKIAARRPNRLHSPRPGELRAMLNEISGCLTAAAR